MKEKIPVLDKETRLATHKAELQAYGLRGLEGRIQRGLDPAGMLAVSETRSMIDVVAQGANIKMEDLDALTKALHVGAMWDKAEDLAQGKKPEVRGWMLLADECREKNDKDLEADEYIEDVERIKADLATAGNDPEEALDRAVEHITKTAHEKFVLKDGIPFSEEDAFLHMAIAGKKFGVCKAGDLYFAGAPELDYSVLEQEGLVPTDRENRGRMATFFQRNGVDVVKKLYPGLAIVFGDEELALRLAKSAEKFFK